jgi:hypothetical protein
MLRHNLILKKKMFCEVSRYLFFYISFLIALFLFNLSETLKREQVSMHGRRVLFLDDDPANIIEFSQIAPEVRSFLVETPMGQVGGGRPKKGGMTLQTIDSVADLPWAAGDVVLFDWDLTLSAYNGLQLPHPDVAAAALYYSGGRVRFEHLKRMFSALRRKKVKVFVLTNNPTAAAPRDRRHFLDILQVLDPKFLMSELVYGHQQKAVVYKTNREILKAVHSPLNKKRFTRKKILE